MIVLLPDSAKHTIDPTLDILRSARNIAVVGISGKPYRPSNEVSAYLLAAGYRIFGVNPNETEVHGQKCYARLEDIPQPIDIVDIFRRSAELAAVVESAIRIRARAVWMQLGLQDTAAAEKARAAGLSIVMDACMLIEHRKRRLELSK